MIIRLHFKTPDVVRNWIAGYLDDFSPEVVLTESELAEYQEDPEAWKAWEEERLEEILKRWIQYGELITVEINTDDRTAKVLEQR